MSSQKLVKKGDCYYPSKEIKQEAWVKDESVYQKAEQDPQKFWAQRAQKLFWNKKWDKVFEHDPPYFKWFKGGKINITSNIFEHNPQGFEKIKDKKALIWEPEPPEEESLTLTYQELLGRVNRLANALKEIGVEKGDRVGIYLPMIPEAMISMLACARIGAVHSVVFSAYSPQALKIRLQDTKAKVLITADGYFRRGKIIDLKKNADQGVKDTSVEKVIVVSRLGKAQSKEAHQAREKVNMEPDRDIWYEDLIEGKSDSCDPEVMDSEDLIFLLYTSGSTGKPKGCQHVCGGYTTQAYWTGKWIFDLHPEDIFWCTADIGWITGHTYAVYSPLLNGVTTIIFEGAPDFPEPDRWAKIIEKYGVTIFYTAPTAVRLFEKYGAEVLKDHDFESLRLLGSVGEPIDVAAWEWYFKEVGKEKCPIVDTWWQTETGGILISSLPGIGPFKPAYVGKPFPGIKVGVLDENGEKVPPGQEGNLVIYPPFAPSVLRGVYKNPQKYLDTYWSKYGEEIYFTEDRAQRDENGLIRIVGRADDVIKVAGHRLTTGEIESAITKLPYITECAVVGIPHEIKGEVPAAFVVSKKTIELEQLQKEVVQQVRKEISPIALPSQVYLVEDLPKTRSGKIMRRVLKALFTGEDLGDLSTLANPQIVEQIKDKVED